MIAPTMRHERRQEIRTAQAIAVNGPMRSHQNAGSATMNRAVGQTSGTATTNSASPGKMLVNIGPRPNNSSGNPSAPMVAMMAAGQRRTAVRTSARKLGRSPCDSVYSRSVIMPNRATSSSIETSITTWLSVTPSAAALPPPNGLAMTGIRKPSSRKVEISVGSSSTSTARPE